MTNILAVSSHRGAGFSSWLPWCHHEKKWAGGVSLNSNQWNWVCIKKSWSWLNKMRREIVRTLRFGFPSALQRHLGATWRRWSGRGYADDASGGHLVGDGGSQNSQWAVVTWVQHRRSWCLASHSRGGILLRRICHTNCWESFWLI